MNTTNHSLLFSPAPDALFERIERDLCALVTAPLDAQDAAPQEAVDEFSDAFPVHFALPPKRRRLM